jgi:hypothetical protein
MTRGAAHGLSQPPRLRQPLPRWRAWRPLRAPCRGLSSQSCAPWTAATAVLTTSAGVTTHQTGNGAPTPTHAHIRPQASTEEGRGQSARWTPRLQKGERVGGAGRRGLTGDVPAAGAAAAPATALAPLPATAAAGAPLPAPAASPPAPFPATALPLGFPATALPAEYAHARPRAPTQAPAQARVSIATEPWRVSTCAHAPHPSRASREGQAGTGGSARCTRRHADADKPAEEGAGFGAGEAPAPAPAALPLPAATTAAPTAFSFETLGAVAAGPAPAAGLAFGLPFLGAPAPAPAPAPDTGEGHIASHTCGTAHRRGITCLARAMRLREGRRVSSVGRRQGHTAGDDKDTCCLSSNRKQAVSQSAATRPNRATLPACTHTPAPAARLAAAALPGAAAAGFGEAFSSAANSSVRSRTFDSSTLARLPITSD